MKRYNPKSVEPKWQKIWEEHQSYQAVDDFSLPKMYVSGMFPYPSGAGMHAGHAFSYTIVDVLARFYRQHGKNVLNPMGYDTFGLPAENYAIKTGTAPAEVTLENIANFRQQFKRLGHSIDWSREINTSDPEYYRWTQTLFIEFFKRGLAYQKDSLQWWCPVDKTVLANEQVESGRCWRCGSEVSKKSMKQWFFKITDYADVLLDEIANLNWPDKIKTAQTNWIGRSEGAEINFGVKASAEIAPADDERSITVFTTRPDTLYGVTFIVLAPEHPLVKTITTHDQKDAVGRYVKQALAKSDIERQQAEGEKTGVFTGSYAINPASGEEVPIWVADYVLYGYGTGAVMAVPAHDERDNEFAQTFELPIRSVVRPVASSGEVFTDEGEIINSGIYNGLNSSSAREKIVADLEGRGAAKAVTNYKMHDWLISRQRYWGAPIPIVHCPTHGAVAVPADQLPVELPKVDDYAPKGDGRSVLAEVSDWVNTICPECGSPAKRETDTMDGYACSSWYLLRYTDPHNQSSAWAADKANYWSPVDYYVGGDHAVAHLLYVRFWTHVFHDMGLIDFKEPVSQLVYHGYVNAPDGRKMSKSLGNVIDPLHVIDQGYGADALRTYMLFMGPIEDNSAWDPKGIAGVYRFLNRVWVLVQEHLNAQSTETERQPDLDRVVHATIKRVTEDIRDLDFNTAIAALMEAVNKLYKIKTKHPVGTPQWAESLQNLVQLLAPFAPHISEELWQQLGQTQLIHKTHWPDWNDSLLQAQTFNIVVQVQGKVRANIEVAAGAAEDEITQAATSHSNVQQHLDGKTIIKTIYVPNKLINFVVR